MKEILVLTIVLIIISVSVHITYDSKDVTTTRTYSQQNFTNLQRCVSATHITAPPDNLIRVNKTHYCVK